MRAPGTTRFVCPAFALSAGLVIAGLAGWSTGCRWPSHDRVEVSQGDCQVCHAAEYQATTAPPHVGLFPESCAQCHVTTAWQPAVPVGPVEHPWFAIENSHAGLACADCHTAGYGPGDTPNTCDGCHLADAQAVTSPSHAGFPTDCQTCHSDAGWVPSSFVHPWRLDGAHASAACTSCHAGDPPKYAGTPSACVGCHLDDYDASPHGTSYASTCNDCHDTVAWADVAGGGHPDNLFPRTGSHNVACADCHDETLGSYVDGMNTNCVGCHSGAHSRSRMDPRHADVSGYLEDAAASPYHFCLVCHPDGQRHD